MTTYRIVRPAAERRVDRAAQRLGERICELRQYAMRRTTTAEAAQAANAQADRLQDIYSRAMRCIGYDEFA